MLYQLKPLYPLGMGVSQFTHQAIALHSDIACASLLAESSEESSSETVHSNVIGGSWNVGVALAAQGSKSMVRARGNT